ncbi:DUF4180 domain-containing protein [Rapidithrix thailandica]|uniref:DUF4180 domain-containing protein n=1 Tax=Rapidithrix thailandica TaxID=413964 RepID=A0AAW9SLG3_9BACT
MEIKTHLFNGSKIAEIISDRIVIASAEEGLDVLGNVYYQGFDSLVLHQQNITPDFFDLKTQMAGEILQKFSNYRVRLAIVGDFTQVDSQSLRDFIFESNKTGLVNFVNSTQQALEILSSC